jgi:hypothetical protein
VAIVEEAFESAFNGEGGKRSPEDAERRLIFYVVPQQRASGVRLNYMAMPPAFERPAHLYVLKHARRIISRVQRLPSHSVKTKEPRFYDRSCPHLQIYWRHKDARLLPRRQQSFERVRQLMKSEDAFGSSTYDALFDEMHKSRDG